MARKIHKNTPAESAAYRRKLAEVEADKGKIMKSLREFEGEYERRFAEFRDVFAALRDERQRRGMSLADVEELTGMPRAAISRLENGQKANFHVDTILRYADALGLKLHVAIG